MLKKLILGFMVAMTAAGAAQARPHHHRHHVATHHHGHHRQMAVITPDAPHPFVAVPDVQGIPNPFAGFFEDLANSGHRVVDDVGSKTRTVVNGVSDATRNLYSHSTQIASELVAKANELVSDCGSHVVSGVRPHAVVRGSGHPSMHRDGHAIDMAGNPSCMYEHLAGWPGGYSVDYNAVNHIHISYEPNGREWGARFMHYGHRSIYPGQLAAWQSRHHWALRGGYSLASMTVDRPHHHHHRRHKV